MKKLIPWLCLVYGCSSPPPAQAPPNLQSQMQQDMQHQEEARRAYLKSPAGQKTLQESSDVARRAAESDAARRQQMEAVGRMQQQPIR